MRIRSTLLLTLLACLTGCAHSPSTRQPRTGIMGYVFDHLLYPVEGATITLVQQRASATSGVRGAFLLGDVPAGVYDVRVRGGGVREDSMKLVRVAPSDSTCVLFVLQRVAPPDSGRGGPPASPLIVLNGAPVLMSEARSPRDPNAVIQLRSANVVSIANVPPDSARQLYGSRASHGATLVVTLPHAPCS